MYFGRGDYVQYLFNARKQERKGKERKERVECLSVWKATNGRQNGYARIPEHPGERSVLSNTIANPNRFKMKTVHNFRMCTKKPKQTSNIVGGGARRLMIII